MFWATPNSAGENGDKKQNTLPYTLQVKVVEVCLVGAGDESRAFGGAPRWTIINCPFCRQVVCYITRIGQNARSRSRLHPRLSPRFGLFPKIKVGRTRRPTFILEQVNRSKPCTLPTLSKPIF